MIELSLLEAWKNEKCIKSRNKFVENWLPFVQKTAHKYRNIANTDDLIQEGMLEAISCCDTYQLDSKFKFVTHLHMRLRNRFADYIKHDVLMRRAQYDHGKLIKTDPTSHSEIISESERTGLSYKYVMNYCLSGKFIEFDDNLYQNSQNTTENTVIAAENAKLLDLASSSLDEICLWKLKKTLNQQKPKLKVDKNTKTILNHLKNHLES